LKRKRRRNQGKPRGKGRMFVYFGVAIFIFAIFGYALLSSRSVPGESNVHWHATITIEGVDMKSLKQAEDFKAHPPIHLHRGDSTPTLHMEGGPIPLGVFFKSIKFDTSMYQVYVTGAEKDVDYIFQDGDNIELRRR